MFVILRTNSGRTLNSVVLQKDGYVMLIQVCDSKLKIDADVLEISDIASP